MTAPLKSKEELAVEYGSLLLEESDKALARLAYSVGFDAGFQRAGTANGASRDAGLELTRDGHELRNHSNSRITRL